MNILIILCVVWVLSLLFTHYLVHRPHQHWLSCINHANERSLHQNPTHGNGGLAILASVSLGLCAAHGLLPAPSLPLAPVYAGALLLATVSFIDDKHPISPWWRLLVHFIAASLLFFNDLHWPALPVVSWLWVVWMINLYNFMDGMDGFAGGMTVFGFGGLAIAGYWAEQPFFATSAALLAVSSVGFLRFNFPPARIFMGDVGSSTLGYIASVLILWAAQAKILPLGAGLLLFSPFIVDATVTIVIRLFNKEKIWQAHKTHHYQRLVNHGWTHQKTVLHSYGLMAACAGSALAMLWLNPLFQNGLLLAWAGIYGLLCYRIRRIGRDTHA
jgi:UDP-N-acetylmuramyl pentapeptide phosphotransferase/UDP-N-acetylglucosamine-1-phosphate transferase